MATLQDVLTVPPGYTVVAAQQVVDITSVDPSTRVETEVTELWAVDVAGLELGVPSIASGLQDAARQFGSNVYGVALLRKDTPDQVCDPFGLGICLPGNVVSVTRYRWVIVHSQFQAIAILLGLLVAAGLVIVWICNERPSASPCSDQVQGYAHDTLQQMCDIFGAGCALRGLAYVLIGTSLLSIAFAGVLFFAESGVAQQMGIKAPGLPAIRPPQPPTPRISVSAPTLGGLGINAGAGGRGRRGG